MALPPQMAVPDAIRYEGIFPMLSHFPTIIPISITLTTENRVNSIPSEPALTESSKFIPNPKPTTEICSKYLEAFLLNAGKGEPKVNAKTKPKNSAMGAETNGVKQKNARIRYMIQLRCFEETE